MTVKINVKGAIIENDYKEIYDFYQSESTCPNDILQTLPKNGEPIEVVINSGGGHVTAGSEIYSILKEYQGSVTVKIVGIAASAASVIAMSGQKVIIAPTAQIMIHNVSGFAQGDFNEMQHRADVLKEINRSIANAYILKTGKSEKEILELMNKETFFSARKAHEFGFVDEIMGVPEEDLSKFLVANTNISSMLPQGVIEKYREMKVNSTSKEKVDGFSRIAKAFTNATSVLNKK